MTGEENDDQDVEVNPLDVMSPEPGEIPNADGTTTIILEDEQAAPADGAWFDNLATILPEDRLEDLAANFLELIDQDIEDRKERDKMQADGLKKSGIGDPAPGGANFEGASTCTHPLLAESYIDFASSAIKELFPPNGPVKMKIDGKPNKEKMDKAKRKAEFMNWQLTREIPSYRPELERLLTQLPVGGSQYMKIYWDEDKGAPDVEFVPVDDMILPYHARNFFDLPRKFHRMNLNAFTYERRVQSGQYRDVSFPESYGTDFQRTDSAKATDRIEGKSNDYTGDSDERLVYEGCVYIDIGDPRAPEGRAVPYLITIDEQSRKILALYRNWNEKDKKYREIDYLVDWTFIPWRGVLGLSLLQCLGGLPDALTGALRAILDSALINNTPGGIKMKGLPGGASLSVSPTEITEVDGGQTDDIRKLYMPLPFNPPSTMLYQLLGFLTAAGKEVVGTAEEKIADASNNMPVGTTLALIEQGAKVFSAIHARLQDSQRRCLEILHRLNKDHLPEEKTVFGSDDTDFVTRADFEGHMDVRPVSDPNIFSETQRFAQVQFVMQSLLQAAPVIPQVQQMFDIRALFARAFEMAKIPDYEEFLPEQPKAEMLNPADENVAIIMGKPVKAYKGQNHEAHIQVLLDFAKNPLFGSNPIVAQKFLTPAMNHLMDHLLVWYEEMMKKNSEIDAGHPLDDEALNLDPNSAVLMAKSTAVIDHAANIAFASIPAIVAKGMQTLQAMMPKPPLDPMVQIAAQDIQGKQQIATQQLSLAQSKAAADAQSKMLVAQQKADQARMDYEIAMRKIGVESQADMAKAELQSKTDLAQTLHDNQSAKEIAMMNIAAGKGTKLKTGASLSKEGE